jgi:SAM-dependent methyltransferase
MTRNEQIGARSPAASKPGHVAALRPDQDVISSRACPRPALRKTPIAQHADARRIAPATARNREPILAVLRPQLPAAGTVLEIASGSGEHVVAFARTLPDLVWQPSDPSPEARDSIAAWTAAERLQNVRPPLDLDVSMSDWAVDDVDAVLCINMIHISPWGATEGLMRGAGRLLEPGGLLYLYGPFRRSGVATAPSNEAFDSDLRRRDARWGLRDLEAVADCAGAEGLILEQVVDMPANNLSLLFRRRHRA